jgi:hypothetical protein
MWSSNYVELFEVVLEGGGGGGEGGENQVSSPIEELVRL